MRLQNAHDDSLEATTRNLNMSFFVINYRPTENVLVQTNNWKDETLEYIQYI